MSHNQHDTISATIFHILISLHPEFFPLINFQGVAIIKLTFQQKRQLRLAKTNTFPYICGTREWQSLNLKSDL